MKMLKFNTTQKIILCVGALLIALRCFSWNAAFWYSGTMIGANSLSEYITRFPAVFIVATVFHCLGIMILTLLPIYLAGVLSTGSLRLKIIVTIIIVLGLSGAGWWIYKRPGAELSSKTAASGKIGSIETFNKLLGELEYLKDALDTDKPLSKTKALSKTNHTETMSMDVLMKELNELAKELDLAEISPQANAVSPTDYVKTLTDLMKELNELSKELELDK